MLSLPCIPDVTKLFWLHQFLCFLSLEFAFVQLVLFVRCLSIFTNMSYVDFLEKSTKSDIDCGQWLWCITET